MSRHVPSGPNTSVPRSIFRAWWSSSSDSRVTYGLTPASIRPSCVCCTKSLMFLIRSHQLGGECNGFCHYLLFKLSRSVDSKFVPKAFLAVSSAFWSNVRSSRSVHLGFLPLGVSPSDHARPVHTQGSQPRRPRHNTSILTIWDIITANTP